VFTVPLQLLVDHIAVRRGTGVDQPRNLARSVTVAWERRASGER
jgi:glucosamine 6-phosphate synthetase-like amidotransferase/phosphosugar isomerase protein